MTCMNTTQRIAALHATLTGLGWRNQLVGRTADNDRSKIWFTHPKYDGIEVYASSYENFFVTAEVVEFGKRTARSLKGVERFVATEVEMDDIRKELAA